MLGTYCIYGGCKGNMQHPRPPKLSTSLGNDLHIQVSYAIKEVFRSPEMVQAIQEAFEEETSSACTGFRLADERILG